MTEISISDENRNNYIYYLFYIFSKHILSKCPKWTVCVFPSLNIIDQCYLHYNNAGWSSSQLVLTDCHHVIYITRVILIKSLQSKSVFIQFKLNMHRAYKYIFLICS